MNTRLHKYLAECGVASRRRAEELISAGKVAVNGVVVTKLGVKIDPERDQIRVEGKPVRPAEKGIMLFNKPRGVVSTMRDPQGRRNISDFLTKRYRSYFPVGRLDTDTSGLMILTNDGDLAERLLHPRHEIDRIYLAKVRGSLASDTIQKLEKGVTLADGIARAWVSIEGELNERGEKYSHLLVTVREGRNRLVRRILDKVGHPVLELKRISHGPFKLGRMKSGEIQKLSNRQYMALRLVIFAGAPED
ncbi:MAG: rRNA pseudouridine synthase [Bdellovibrionales bacterium]|nr:rRNA pseudouridine synthase [Bdellovibrionales bacterium]